MTSDRETKILICCAQKDINPQEIEELLREDIDWAKLLEKAGVNNIKPLLYQSLKKIESKNIPEDVFNQLKAEFRNNNLKNISLTQEMINLVKVFKQANIPIIPYKGTLLASYVYGQINLRTCEDIDFIVETKDFVKTEELCRENGYQLQAEYQWEKTLYNAEKKVYIDIHKKLTPEYFPLIFDFHSIYQRLQPVTIMGQKILTLAPEDLLMVLCIQITKDLWERDAKLAKVCDINELIKTVKTLDWEKVIHLVHVAKCERLFIFGLYVSQQLLGTVLPQAIERKIQDDLAIKLYFEQVIIYLQTKIEPSIERKPWIERLLERIIIEFPKSEKLSMFGLFRYFIMFLLTSQRKK